MIALVVPFSGRSISSRSRAERSASVSISMPVGEISWTETISPVWMFESSDSLRRCFERRSCARSGSRRAAIAIDAPCPNWPRQGKELVYGNACRRPGCGDRRRKRASTTQGRSRTGLQLVPGGHPGGLCRASPAAIILLQPFRTMFLLHFARLRARRREGLRRRATGRSDRGERSISANGEGMVSDRADPKLLAKALARLRSALALLDGT